MDSTHAAETTTTPPIAKYHHEETPADGEKGSSVAGFSDSSESFREEETTEGRSHLNVFCVSLGGGIVAYVIHLLLYPMLLWLITCLFSLIFSSSTTLDDGDGDFAPSALSFAIMMFLM